MALKDMAFKDQSCKDLPSNDPARQFFALAHAIIASEMSVRTVSRRLAEPDDTDPMRIWFAWREHWRSQQDFGNPDKSTDNAY